MFSSSSSRQSMNFKDIVGKGAAKHPSFSPSSSRQLVEDLQLAVYLHEHALMEEGCRAWRSKVVVPGLAVYSKALYPGRVFSVWVPTRTAAAFGLHKGSQLACIPMQACSEQSS